jgi:sulfide:quinone oxidoreductase
MYRPIDPDYAVAGQLQPEDFKAIADAGFRTVMANRPDGEEAAQPHHEVMRAAAEAAGLSFVYIPVGAAFPVEIAARELSRVLADLPKPMLGYCRSGARSTTVYQLARAMG